MKREYVVPCLTVHGNVEELTQASGDVTKVDTFTANGLVINGLSNGSLDVDI